MRDNTVERHYANVEYSGKSGKSGKSGISG
jgi:hypothetical protein